MSGFVYAISVGDLVKIGWSSDPSKRMSKIQSDNGQAAQLIGFVAATKDQEAELHELLQPWNVRGEWFERSPVVEMFVSKLTQPPSIKSRTGRNSFEQWVIDSGLTQEQVAMSLGTTQATISRICSGIYTPRLETAKRIELLTAGKVAAISFVQEALRA